MRESSRDIDINQATSQLKEDEKIDLTERLIQFSKNEIKEVVDLDIEKIKELQRILLMRHPDTGIAPTVSEMRQMLCDIPSFILSLVYQHHNVKSKGEEVDDLIQREMALLRKKYEATIIQERIEYKKEGYSISGTITKETLNDRAILDPHYEEIKKVINKGRKIKFNEEALVKIISVLEKMPYTITKMIDIEMAGDR